MTVNDVVTIDVEAINVVTINDVATIDVVTINVVTINDVATIDLVTQSLRPEAPYTPCSCSSSD